MREFMIVTDSSCDLSQDLVTNLGVHVVPLTVHYQGEQFDNYPDNHELSTEDFYNGIREGEMPSTSAVSVGRWSEELEQFLQAGKDVLVLAFSSGLSTTYQSAVIAANDLVAAYPDRQIAVVDTLCASMGEGLLVWHAVQQQKQGKSLEEVRDYVEANKLHLCHWFTVDDLFHLKRGGRVSAATAIAGTLLNIKPVLHVDNEGHLINMSKSRGRKASLDALVDRMAKTAIDPAGQTVFISHSDCLADAEYVAKQCKEKLGVPEVIINYIGPVIGAHTGIGTVALFFLGSER
jgi:DegV family protein with EDD domain